MLCYFCPITSIQCVRVGSLHVGEDPGSQTLVNSTSTWKMGVAHANSLHADFLPTLIGLFSVVSTSFDRNSCKM